MFHAMIGKTSGNFFNYRFIYAELIKLKHMLPILDHIELLFLTPKTTSVLQPLDAGIIKSPRARYRKQQLQRTISPEENRHEDIYVRWINCWA